METMLGEDQTKPFAKRMENGVLMFPQNVVINFASYNIDKFVSEYLMINIFAWRHK